MQSALCLNNIPAADVESGSQQGEVESAERCSELGVTAW